MGDRRFDPPYQRLQGADRLQVIRTMSDEDVISALAAASRAQDPYLANVLATAAHNRIRKARAVAEQISEGLCTLDVHGLVQQINPRGCELLGVTAEEVVGKDFHGLVHPHHAAGSGDGNGCDMEGVLWTDAAARADSTFASRHRTFGAHVSAAAIRVDETIDGRVLLFQDVSQRKLQEELLQRQRKVLESAVETSLTEVRKRREAEDMFRHLFEAGPDPSVVTDDGNRILLLNASAHTLTGYGLEALGLPADLLLEASTDGPSPRWSDLTRGMAVVVRRRDGSTLKADVATSALVGPNGQMRLVTLRDVASTPVGS